MTTATLNLADDYADVSDPSGEPIAVWERVSTDMSRQDITSQTRDLKAYVSAGSYRVERVFRFEASAFHGKHTGQQAEMMADVEAGRYATIVAAMSSRYERRGWQHAMITALQLHTLGARIVAIDDEHYGDMSSELGGISTMLKAKSNHDYSQAISDNVSRKFRVMDAEGYHRGGIPAGYVAEGAKGSKRLVKRAAVAELVVAAFVDSAAGKSTVRIARTFKAASERYGLRLPVTADGVAKMLRSPEYSTGSHKPGSACQCKFPPLVSPAQQRDAIAAISERTTGDNVSSRAIAKEDFSGALFCGSGDVQHGRMYRYTGGGKPKSDGTPTPRVRRYRCESCGKSVNAGYADAEVNRVMSAQSWPWLVPFTTDPNADRDRRIAEIDAELASLPVAKTPSDRAERRRTEDSLYAERDNLASIPDKPAETYATRKTDDSGRELTEGDRWTQMTPAEQRDELTAGSVYVYVRSAPGRTGAVLVTTEFEASQE
jgi:DNA invertase Pin-like site-specific DNA recombinase